MANLIFCHQTGVTVTLGHPKRCENYVQNCSVNSIPGIKHSRKVDADETSLESPNTHENCCDIKKLILMNVIGSLFGHTND